MTTIYVRHDVTTIAEVNALALDEDQRENGAIVLYEGSTCYWSINWATRNEIPGRWYDNSSDGLQLVDGDEVTVLVPIEAEEEAQGITTWPRPDNAPWPRDSQLCGGSEGSYYYRDEDGVAHDITEEVSVWMAAQPVRTRLVTPWEEA